MVKTSKSAVSEQHVTDSKRKVKKQRLYKIKLRTVKSDFYTNMRHACIKIMDDNWSWYENFLIDADKAKEFRTYVKSDEFADFVCDLIGPDFKGLNGIGMWNLRNEKYKTGIVYYQEIHNKLKQYKWKDNY